MRRGDPDAGSGVHGLEQVSGQVAERAVKRGHGLRRERKPRVGITDNRTDGHDLCDCCPRCRRPADDRTIGISEITPKPDMTPTCQNRRE